MRNIDCIFIRRTFYTRGTLKTDKYREEYVVIYYFIQINQFTFFFF